MENAPPSQTLGSEKPPSPRRIWRYGILLLLLLAGIACWISFQGEQPIQVAIADGRIIQIEGVTYGMKHRMGQPSVVLNRFQPWLPQRIYDWLKPKHPESTIELDRPALVIWINAVDPKTGTNVDCQRLRTELVGQKGDLFESHPHWSGSQKFWRVGHVFYSWPRDEKLLTWRITPHRMDLTSVVRLHNPHVTSALNWTGQPLPQTRLLGETELVLDGLQTRTNGSKSRYWVTPSTYWEPVFEFRRNGQPVTGWSQPEWTAEDPLGNRGQFLGVHQPALRVSVSVYPEATNIEDAQTLAVLPQIDLTTLQTNLWWNRPLGSSNLVALGICPPGVCHFSGGQFDPNPVSKMGAVRGGSPSGWTSSRKQVNPLQVKTTYAHYSDKPTIYLRADDLKQGERLAVRLKDDQGRSWAAKPESQGAPEGVRPFLLDLPPGLTNITAEIAILKPLQAAFDVDTKSYISP
jgi:hypothetical protein